MWAKSIVSPEDSILATLNVIDQSAMKMALVVDANGSLLGLVTDGDMRRALLRGLSFDTAIANVMNSNPISVGRNASLEDILRVFRQHDIDVLPVVDDLRRVIRVEFLSELLRVTGHDNLVVVMAGGLGTRLRPLTEDTPKPMLPVAGRPMLESILENLINQGFHRFRLAVNYKSDLIENHFGDGSKWNVEIEYLREKKRLGTAGALSLLDPSPDKPTLVVNGDVLVRMDFGRLLRFGEDRRAAAVLCVREHRLQVPYGVVMTAGDRLLSIAEKPIYSYFINAGIYLLAPEAVAMIPHREYFDMPSLLEALIEAGREVLTHPVDDFWLDVGRKEDLERANAEMREGTPDD